MSLKDLSHKTKPHSCGAFLFFLLPTKCREPESNRRPFPLQGNALPTELSRRAYNHFLQKSSSRGRLEVYLASSCFNKRIEPFPVNQTQISHLPSRKGMP